MSDGFLIGVVTFGATALVLTGYMVYEARREFPGPATIRKEG